MKNISVNGEDIKLKAGETYYIIDALYLHQIKEDLTEVPENENLDSILNNKVFPYTDTPYAKIIVKDEIFKINSIQSINYNDVEANDMCCFSTDSGLLILVKEAYLKELIICFDYDKLTDSVQEDINIQYWEEITSNYEEFETALILAPGVNTMYDFVGSGTYKIIQ
jgi:hypothetical protein